MYVECFGGPWDGLLLSTSAPIAGVVVWLDGKRGFRKPAVGRHPYIYDGTHCAEHGAKVLRHATKDYRICQGCGVLHRSCISERCTLCGGGLRAVSGNEG